MTGERESEGGKCERSGGPLAIAITLCLMPILYLLSTGPIIWLEHRGYITDNRILVVIYYPVRLLIQSSSVIEKMFRLWSSLWELG
jgi:hypothetical protein